jgi:hypothetical protein
MDEIPEGYVRVTQVLKPFTPFEHMDPDSRFACNVKAAADRGRRVHELCEAHALGLFVEECDADCKNYFHSFRRWFDEMVCHTYVTEQRLNSEDMRLSGAVDMVCQLKGDDYLTLVDIKTPQSDSKTWQLQTAAYKLLLKEAGIKVHRRVCIMLPKTTSEVKVIEYTDHAKDEQRFLQCLELYRFFNG